MAVWPATLPQSLEIASHSEVDEARVVTFQTDVGPAIIRRRASAAVRQVSGSLLMTFEQFDTLHAFFRDTCAAGAIPFEWRNHLTDNTCSYRWRQPPSVQPRGSRAGGRDVSKVRVQLELEIMPGSEIVNPITPDPGTPPEPQQLIGLDPLPFNRVDTSLPDLFAILVEPPPAAVAGIDLTFFPSLTFASTSSFGLFTTEDQLGVGTQITFEPPDASGNPGNITASA